MTQARNQGRDPGGLDPCPFQQKNETSFFVVPPLFMKGVSLT